MSVIVLLIVAGGSIAAGFLGAFFWAVQSGQYDDTWTHGIQPECVNCTACIDACDDVMRRIHRPTGLIRFASHEAILRGRGRMLSGRAAAYGAVWIGWWPPPRCCWPAGRTWTS